MNKILCIDYLFMGNVDKQLICFDEFLELFVWVGRCYYLLELFLEGNGQIVMCDVVSGKVIYMILFFLFFQEWFEIDEVKEVIKGFENIYFFFYFIKLVEVEIILCNNKCEVSVNLKYVVKFDDILIYKKGFIYIILYKYLLKSGNEE